MRAIKLVQIFDVICCLCVRAVHTCIHLYIYYTTMELRENIGRAFYTYYRALNIHHVSIHGFIAT